MTTSPVKRVLYFSGIVITRATDGRVTDSETYHCLLENVTVNGVTMPRLRLTCQRSLGSWQTFVGLGYKGYTNVNNVHEIRGRGNVYSTNDTITLRISKIGTLCNVSLEIRDALGNVKYNRPYANANFSILEVGE